MFDPWIFDKEGFHTMSTIDIILNGVCDGGDHLTVSFTPNGRVKKTYVYQLSDLTNNPLTDDEMQRFVSDYLRMYAQDKAGALIKNRLISGMGIVI